MTVSLAVINDDTPPLGPGLGRGASFALSGFSNLGVSAISVADVRSFSSTKLFLLSCSVAVGGGSDTVGSFRPEWVSCDIAVSEDFGGRCSGR